MVDVHQSGFGNYFRTEAVSGALPIGRNSPQKTPLGLYAELLSGHAFTAPRAENRRTWVYRIRPSAAQNSRFQRLGESKLCSAPIMNAHPSPEPMRWDPRPIPEEPTDFIESLFTLAASGDLRMQTGCAAHIYAANKSMTRKAFYNADGEMLIVPQLNRLRLVTELGVIVVTPGEIAVIPRGLRFRVELPDDVARGYICENYGQMFRLPELGPIGSNGLANPRDFLAPVAAFEDDEQAHELICKFEGSLWRSETLTTPFDVVGWHGNLAPYKYDLAHFMAIGTVSFDHPDPSINTVLTSPSEIPGTANVDFVIFPPRWLVAENTFRPPWYHRNTMSEFMGLVHGVYDAKAEGFLPGGASLHNNWTAHGPDEATYQRAIAADLKPHKIEATLAFMFESRFAFRPTTAAQSGAGLQSDYIDCWQGFSRHLPLNIQARSDG